MYICIYVYTRITMFKLNTLYTLDAEEFKYEYSFFVLKTFEQFGSVVE